jgi:phosphate:Na+ symporter
MNIEASNLWQLLGGLGIFLFGMYLMEGALNQLGGRTFKLFLRKNTRKRVPAVMSGALVTGVLQSSSVVTFMVLAFVGAGILKMRNALAVDMGANLGTTIDSWMVALLGFNLNFDLFSMIIIAAAAGGVMFSGKRKKLKELSLFLMGFGFLFFGLEQMKTGMSGTVKDFDFTPYAGYNRIVFVGLGFLITALIQSSSATVAITLSALHAGVFPLEVAVAIVVGAELGSSVKNALGAIGGNADKKRVTAGNIIFNITITTLGFFMIGPLIAFIHAIGLKDPLLVLVCFQSMINLTGILIFLPLLDPYARFLEKRFRGNEDPP